MISAAAISLTTVHSIPAKVFYIRRWWLQLTLMVCYQYMSRMSCWKISCSITHSLLQQWFLICTDHKFMSSFDFIYTSTASRSWEHSRSILSLPTPHTSCPFQICRLQYHTLSGHARPTLLPTFITQICCSFIDINNLTIRHFHSYCNTNFQARWPAVQICLCHQQKAGYAVCSDG